MEIPKEKLDLYDQLVQNNPAVERKGKTTPYTSINGHMFSFLDKEGNMGLRLDKEALEEFMIKFDSKLMVQHGRTMKEYVVIPEDLLRNTKELSTYLKKSLAYVTGLKPKPTKKKK